MFLLSPTIAACHTALCVRRVHFAARSLSLSLTLQTHAYTAQNTSSYAIPQKMTHEEWFKQTPDGFVFHFKAFGLLTQMSVPVNSLPWQVKDKLPDIVKLKESVSQSDLG